MHVTPNRPVVTQQGEGADAPLRSSLAGAHIRRRSWRLAEAKPRPPQRPGTRRDQLPYQGSRLHGRDHDPVTPEDRSAPQRPSLVPPIPPRQAEALARGGVESRPARLMAAGRGIASVAGVVTTLGLVVVLAPSLTEGYTGRTAPSGTDIRSVPPLGAADVVETPAPSPVKAERAPKATPTPKHSRKATATAKPSATRRPAAPAPKAAPKPAPRPRPKPTPVPTAASGKP